MTSMSILHDLPMDIALNVMEMLKPMDIGRLDSATVCHSYREMLSETLKAHRQSLSINGPRLFPQLIWFCKRRVKVDKLETRLQFLGSLIKTEQIRLDALQESHLELGTYDNDDSIDDGLWLLQQEKFLSKQLKLEMKVFDIKILEAFASHPIQTKSLHVSFGKIRDSLSILNRQEISSWLESWSCDSFRQVAFLPTPSNNLNFAATYPFTNLRIINWSRMELCPLLAQLVRLTPNLEEFCSNNAENAAAILESPSTSLTSLVLSRLDVGEALPNLIEQVSCRPFARCLNHLCLGRMDRRYPSHYMRRITQFHNLRSLSLGGASCNDEDLLFISENPTLTDLSLCGLYNTSHRLYEVLFRTLANVDFLSLTPSESSIIMNSRDVAFPNEGPVVTSLSSLKFGNFMLNTDNNKYLVHFESQFIDMLGSGRFPNMPFVTLIC